MAGMQPPTISGPNAASGPVNGLNSPTTSVDAGLLPPEEPQAATERSASAAPRAITASFITHLQMMSRQDRSVRQGYQPSRRGSRATASISTNASGMASALTSTSVLAGRASPKYRRRTVLTAGRAATVRRQPPPPP